MVVRDVFLCGASGVGFSVVSEWFLFLGLMLVIFVFVTFFCVNTTTVIVALRCWSASPFYRESVCFLFFFPPPCQAILYGHDEFVFCLPWFYFSSVCRTQLFFFFFLMFSSMRLIAPGRTADTASQKDLPPMF